MQKRSLEEQNISISPAEIRKIAQDALTSNELSHVTALVELCRHADSAVAFTAITCTEFTFGKLLERGLLAKAESESQNEKAQWLREHRKSFLSILASTLNSADLRLQMTAFEKYLNVIKLISEESGEFSNRLYIPLVDALIRTHLSSVLSEKVISMLNSYDDLRFFFFKDAAKICKDKPINTVQAKKAKNHAVASWLSLLSKLDPASKSITYFADLTSKESKKNKSVADFKIYKRAFSDCWLAFMTLPMNTATYTQVLEILHANLIPHLSEPVQLMDFLVDAYDGGGLVSLLALNGLFTLINQHNLNYDHFYDKLYALFDGNLMHVKYRSRFFRLVELFLSSTHIPSYMVCAFIKRMMRLCLNAPPGAIIIVLPFVFNLMKLHPSAITLIHNPKASLEPMEGILIFIHRSIRVRYYRTR